MKGRYVLIGGTGFFGGALAEELRRRGGEVVTVGRGRRGRPTVRAELPGETAPLAALLEPEDTVVYMVGLSPLFRPLGGRRRYREAHLSGLVAALAVARRNGVSRFVQVSALGVTRRCGAAYGETKARATGVLRASAVAGCVAKPSILFGEEGEIVRALSLLSRLPLLPMPTLEARFRPIHVSDAACRLAEAVTAEQLPEEVELAGPELLSFPQVASVYLRRRGTRVIPVPPGISRVAVALLSRIKIPGFPAELEAMLAIDNAGRTPDSPEEMTRFTRWSAPS